MRLQQAAQPPPVMLVAVAWRGCGILPAPCQSPARHHPLSTYPLSPVLGKFLHSKNRVCFGSAAPSSVAQGRHHLSARLERGWAHRMGLRARTPPSSRRRSQIPRPQRRGRLRPMRPRRRTGRPRGRGAALADSPDPSNQAPSAPMSAASSRGFARMCLSPCSAARGAASPPTSRTGRTLVSAAQGDACRPAWRGFAAGAGAAERESQIHAVCAGLGRGGNRHSQTLPGLAIGAGLLRDSWALRLQPCIAASSRAHIEASLQAGTVVISLAAAAGVTLFTSAPLQTWGLGPPVRERCLWLGGAPCAALSARIQLPRSAAHCERPSWARCGHMRAHREGLLAYRDHPGARTPPDGLDPALFR